MGADPADLMLFAEEFLAACEEALDTVPIAIPGLEGAPARSFIAPGQPAADCCPQLTVHVVGVSEDQLGAFVPGRSAMTSRVNQVTLAMTLYRCAETEKVMPLESELIAAATQVNADGWALWNHLYNLRCAGALSTLCDSVEWVSLTPIVPSGGCGGWVLTARMQLDGYQETIASS